MTHTLRQQLSPGAVRKWLTPAKRATFGAVVSGVAIQAALIVSGTLVARLLGPADRGYLALLTLFPAVLAQIGSLGVPLAVTYELSRRPTLGRTLVRAAGQLGAVQAIAATGIHATVMWALYLDGSAGLAKAALISLSGTPALLASFYGLALLQGTQQLRLLNWIRVVPSFAYSVVVVALFLFHEDTLVLVTLAWVGSYALGAIVSIILAVRRLASADSDHAAPRRPLLTFGLKGLPGYMSPLDTFRLDQAVVGLFLSPRLLGLYVVALAVTNLPRFIAHSVGAIAFPSIAARRDPRSAWRAVWRFSALATVLAAALALVLVVSVPFLIPLFFGDSFRGAVPLAQILLPGTIALAARRVLGEALRGVGAPELGTIAEVASWAWLVPALAILVPRFGVDGVAIAITSSYLASLVVLAALAWSLWRRSASLPAAGAGT